VKQNEPKHPSGLTMARWMWPFKTDAERKKIIAWLKKEQRNKLPEALL